MLDLDQFLDLVLVQVLDQVLVLRAGRLVGRGVSGVRERGAVGRVNNYVFLFSWRDLWPGKEVEVQQRSPRNDCKFNRWQQNG